MNKLVEMDQLDFAQNWNFARDFPVIDANTIARPYFLETIVDILTPENPVVFLEGDEGDGATTTLAQFCLKYPDQTFSLFIKPASRFAYSLDYLRLALAEQFYWYLYSKVFDKPFLDHSEFSTLIHHVRRKKKASTLYFVVDGLHQIPSEDQRMVESIIKEVLPLGIDNFRFIISGQQAEIGKYISKVGSKPYQQLRFRPEDTEIYLAGLGIQPQDISEIHKICKGVPGRIASVKRLLQGGTTLQSILDSEPSKYLEFIRLEFDALETLNQLCLLVLGVMTFAKRPLSKNELAEITGAVEIDFTKIQTSCSFLNCNINSGTMEFVSESHRRFAEKRLEPFQNEALARQVDYLLQNPNSEMALRFLPSYYQQLNQQQAIVDLLSTDHYAKLLETTQSISALRNRADLGAKSASLLKQATGVFKFSLQRSIFVAVASQDALESEVAALVALDQPNKALVLANQAAAKEARLALLVTYARRVKEKRGVVDADLVNFIKELSSEIDFAEIRDRAIEIAADILHFDADLAIKIVEQANKRASNPRDQDEAFAHLSITASLSKIPNRAAVNDKAGKRISDEALQKLTSSFAVLVESLSSEEVIKTVEQMESTHRLFFLKTYVKIRREADNILDVVEYSLDLIIRETSYTPKSRDLAELAIPLPFATKDKIRLDNLISRFETQLGLVAKVAFSKDIVMLQLRLAHAEMSIDSKRACERINETYYEVAAIETPEVQTECYALMLSGLKTIDHDDFLERQQGFRAVIKGELTQVLESVLEHTADHFGAISGAIRALAKDGGEAALDLAAKLNTESRRDQAYSEISRVLAAQEFSSERAASLHKGISLIRSPRIKSQTIYQIFSITEQNKYKGDWIENLVPLSSQVTDPRLACERIISELRIRGDLAIPVDPVFFNTEFVSLIEKVDSKLHIVDLYFKAVEALAKVDMNLANKYYEEGREIKEQINPNSATALDIVQLCLSLLSRAFFPLIRSGIFDNELLVRFSRIVDLIPCSITRTAIYSDLAARAWCAKRSDISKKILQEKCTPLLESAKSTSTHLYNNLIQIIFPVRRAAHATTAFSLLESLSSEDADDALYEAAIFIIRKLSPVDPYFDQEFDKFKLESEDAFDILDIMQHQVSDVSFYGTLSAFIQAVCSKSNKLVFTAQQKTDFARRIRLMIDSKLPDARNISHSGYKIAAIAQTYRLEDIPYTKWDALEQEAKTIKNVADRGYVYLEICESLPSKYDAHRKRLLEQALSLFDSIPSPIDRLSHYESYVLSASKDSVVSAKATLRRAIVLSAEIEPTDRVDKHRRQLIDIADRIEPGLADELVELIDDDPARAYAKQTLKRSADLGKAKRTIANAKVIKDVKKCDVDLLPAAAWKNVAALLSGRLETKSVEVMTEYVSFSAATSVNEAYPILTWYLENLARKFTDQNEVSKFIVPACEALLLSTEMAVAVMAQASMQKSTVHTTNVLEEASDGPVVRPKNREQALKYIAGWLRSNAVDYIKMSDPYFGPMDLSFLRLVLSEAPECKVLILTSKAGLKQHKALNVEIFQEQWAKLLEQDPPETEIIAIGTDGDEKGLIHDRWILSKGCGLRIGTSFSSIGENKLSEISEMEPAKASLCEHHLNKFFDKQRVIDGQKVSYLTFTL